MQAITPSVWGKGLRGQCCRGIAEPWGKSGERPALSRNGKLYSSQARMPTSVLLESSLRVKGKTSKRVLLSRAHRSCACRPCLFSRGGQAFFSRREQERMGYGATHACRVSRLFPRPG